jgi:transposase
MKGWLQRARDSEIKILITMAKILESQMEGLLSWYDHRISSGPMEGTYNNINTIKR